jgi:uncharacterized protein YdeI (YjbR/CyaY-like superfamily)
MQGALLKDPKNILVQQTKNVQSARQIRFGSIKDILKDKATIKAYIKEAIKNNKAGLKVELKETSEYEMPVEFQTAISEMTELKSAFYKLTPGRQRAYLLHFSSAKQSKTRMERVEKYIPKILDSKGLDD